MKRILIFFIVLAQVMALIPQGHAQELPGEKRKFLVTAYYSPLPDQEFYLTGGYESEIRLNGRGTNGADGTQVFLGMLAAPKTYPFGTRIRLPGLGVGEVHDRGGAILTMADYDRIDVWMGRGEEGLGRALNWGARMIEGEIYFPPHQAEQGLSLESVSSELSPGLITRLKERRRVSHSAVFTKSVQEATLQEIQDLQSALTWFGYYSGPIDGILSPAAKEGIILFQLEEKIVPVRGAPGTGVFGPTTREKLKARLETYSPEKEKHQRYLKEVKALLAIGLGRQSSGEEVGALQQMLFELGYYHGPATERYDPETISAVFSFQRDHGILSAAHEAGAGYYGKKTHEALIAALDQRIQILKDYPKEMQTWIPMQRSLPELEELSPVTMMQAPSALRFDLFKAVPEPAPFEFTEDLDLGDRGTSVQKLQEILIAEGHLAAGLNTGSFGPQTRAALIQFQIRKGLPGLGRVGPKTREILNFNLT